MHLATVPGHPQQPFNTPSTASLVFPISSESAAPPTGVPRPQHRTHVMHRFFLRRYRVLAIELSCDDSCVALLEKHPGRVPKVLAHSRATLASAHTGGIIPTAAHEFHQQALANEVQRIVAWDGRLPDLVCPTRGPGMVGSLSAGLQLAKGLSIAWNVPMVGVHHMVGHIAAAFLPKKEDTRNGTESLEIPRFPLWSLLCSGGHTMLVYLKSIVDHEVVANTLDIAAGDALDKCARELGFVGNMLGPELEKYVQGIDDNEKLAFDKIDTASDNHFHLRMTMPMRGPKRLKVPEKVEFSFSSFLSSVQNFKKNGPLTEELRRFCAYKVQETLFAHLADRVRVALTKPGRPFQDFVCSGGVAANGRLREILRTSVKRLHLGDTEADIKLHFPDLSLCTDNAVMIGSAGAEVFEQYRKKSDLGVLPIRKWPMNEWLLADGWVDVSDAEYARVTNNVK